VTRIIAGSARGRRLKVPAGARPTTDRVREALFASLEHLLGGFDGIRVLDLYAGSGALGLEALSRGARQAVLVERDRRAAAIARANCAAVGAAGARVVVASVPGHLAGAPAPHELVLADPPYSATADEVEQVLVALARGWLAPGGVVVVERPTRGPALTWPRGLVAHRQSTYGETTLWYGQVAPEGEDP
jgi:16S rRNA (guanine966-N2)-methyltransferase